MLGTLYFVRIAPVYLKQGWKDGDDKSLILLSSVGGFKETPGMPVYQVSFSTSFEASLSWFEETS